MRPLQIPLFLAGTVGLEKAIKKAGSKVKVPFRGGRGDAIEKETHIDSLKSFRATYMMDLEIM